MPELLCPWEPSTYLFFSSNVPALIHYSHLVAVVSALGIGLFIFANNPKGVVPRLFLLFVSLFSAWAALDVILWATNRPDVVMFAWSLQVLFEPLTYMVAFYLFYLHVYKRLPQFWVNLVVVALLLPLLVFLPTQINLEALSLSACEAIEGPLAKYYTYFVHGVLICSIAILGIRGIPKLKTQAERWTAVYFGLGLVTFLLAFSSGNIIGSFTDDWTLSQYGLFAMPLFAGLIAYSIVRFGAFNAKVIATQMLVIVLAFAVISLTALREIENVRIVAGLTFILVCILGYILVRSVKREIAQREHIEQLAKDLTRANERQVSLIHFITHQIKGFVTKSRNIFSMMKEGDCGALPEAARPMIDQGFESDTKGLAMIQDILNASNIKSGNVEFKMEPFDLKALLEEIIGSLKSAADQKGLALNASLGESMIVTGDRTQLTNVYKNVIDNAIKYTPSGKVDIHLEKKDGMAVFTQTDTGVGITKEDMERLFTEGGHGVASKKVNVESTGFGLYIAKSIIDKHQGHIKAESEGEGKGSVFTIELPA